MVAITGVILVVLLAGLFILFRAMGRMGQQPTASERARHTAHEGRPSGPRTGDLN
ncbi:MAG TPA: hypothetical protein VGF88_10600 [Acidobacteriaceae bacterium]|jgi:hypothetical protein